MLHLEKGGGRELKGRLGTSWAGGQFKLNLSGLRKTIYQQMAQNTREQIKQVIQQSKISLGQRKHQTDAAQGSGEQPGEALPGL